MEDAPERTSAIFPEGAQVPLGTWMPEPFRKKTSTNANEKKNNPNFAARFNI
jgi:hypothetical protein